MKDAVSFALTLAGEIHQRNGEIDRASQCFKKALNHNPFLFTPYQRLCQLGKGKVQFRKLMLRATEFYLTFYTADVGAKSSDIILSSSLILSKI